MNVFAWFKGDRSARHSGPKAKNPVLILLIFLLALGFLLRFAYLLEFRQTPFFNARILDGLDQQTWDELAAMVLAHPVAVAGNPFYQPPGYAYFLALVYAVFGAHNYLAAGFVQVLLDVLAAFLVFLLGRRLWNDRSGLVACGLYCLYRTFIYYSVMLICDGFILFTSVLCLFLLYRVLEKPPEGSRWFWAGLASGLAVITKPTILPFLFLSLLVFLFGPRPSFSAGPTADQKKPRKYYPVGIGLFLAGLLVFVLPVVIRNSWLAGKFVTISTNGPVNWQIGNSADSLGLFVYPKGPLLWPDSPAFWKLWLQKTVFFFSSYEWPQNTSIYLLTAITSVLKLPLFVFGLVVPVGLAGLFFTWNRDRCYLHLYTITSVITIVAFFITDRYRLPATAGFMLLAAGYLEFLIAQAGKIRRQPPPQNSRAAVSIIASLCLIFVLSYVLVVSWSGQRIGEVEVKKYARFTLQDVRSDLQRGATELAQKKWNVYDRFFQDYLAGRIK